MSNFWNQAVETVSAQMAAAQAKLSGGGSGMYQPGTTQHDYFNNRVATEYNRLVRESGSNQYYNYEDKTFRSDTGGDTSQYYSSRPTSDPSNPGMDLDDYLADEEAYAQAIKDGKSMADAMKASAAVAAVTVATAVAAALALQSQRERDRELTNTNTLLDNGNKKVFEPVKDLDPLISPNTNNTKGDSPIPSKNTQINGNGTYDIDDVVRMPNVGSLYDFGVRAYPYGKNHKTHFPFY